MSETTTRVPLEEARAIAGELVGLLGSACHRVVIAGSIRRKRPDVGDIDLVCEPKIERIPAGLFGDIFDERDLLHDLCSRLADQGTLGKRRDVNGRPCWGPNLKRAVYHCLNVDIQAVTDATTWGAWMVVRTGPAPFNKALVTPRSQGGLLPPGFQFKDGFKLYRYGGQVETPTEESVFEALGLPYVEPELRAFPVPPAALGTAIGANSGGRP